MKTAVEKTKPSSRRRSGSHEARCANLSMPQPAQPLQAMADSSAHVQEMIGLQRMVDGSPPVIQRFKRVEDEEADGYPVGSVIASKDEIFRWLSGEELWGQVDTEWCLVGGSAHVEIVEWMLSADFDAVVDALVHTFGVVPQGVDEADEAYEEFFVDKVMSTEDLDIAVSNPEVAMQFPVNQSTQPRLICPEYDKPAVDLLRRMPKCIKLPNGVFVESPASLTGKATGVAAMLMGIKKSATEDAGGSKDRKRTARKELTGKLADSLQLRADRSAGVRQLEQVQARLDGSTHGGTGLPERLRSGLEQSSGFSFEHVRVHYGSSLPAQVGAHAFAQGSHIHLGAGQERHLAHEAWHVVQQHQGRVRPTTRVAGQAVNDDPALEREADRMGAALESGSAITAEQASPGTPR